MAGVPALCKDLDESLESARNVPALVQSQEGEAHDPILTEQTSLLSLSDSSVIAPVIEQSTQSKPDRNVNRNSIQMSDNTPPSHQDRPPDHWILLRECDELRKRNADQSREILQLQSRIQELNQCVDRISGERTHLQQVIQRLQARDFPGAEPGILHRHEAVSAPK